MVMASWLNDGRNHGKDDGKNDGESVKMTKSQQYVCMSPT
jgi:hypothetical protein